MFARMMGQSLGAAVFGTILNYGLYRHLSGANKAIDRLMEPSLRQGIGTAEIDHLIKVVAGGLHNVFLVAGLVAIVALGLTTLLPARLNPARHRLS